MTNDYQFERMLDKVQKLLARAEHPNTPEAEADSCRTTAEAIMFKYKIEQAMLKDGDRHESYNKPMKRRIWIAPMDSDQYDRQYSLAVACFKHADCEMAHEWTINPDDGKYWLAGDIYGYPGDIRYGEMLFVACRITFLARMEPGVDANKSMDENIYDLRSSGVTRVRIAEMVGWITSDVMLAAKGQFIDVESKKKVDLACTRVTSAVKREAKRRGEDASVILGQGNSMDTYRLSFATGFVRTIKFRLMRLRAQHGQDSGAIVLKTRHEDVLEMMYADHPDLRPQSQNAAKFEPCERCAKSKSGTCRKHRVPKMKFVEANMAAMARGADAGNRVDLTGGNVPTGRTSAAPTRHAIN